MSVSYPGYFQAVNTRNDNRQKIFAQVYAACMERQQYCDNADSAARQAVRDFDELFPVPEWPGDKDD